MFFRLIKKIKMSAFLRQTFYILQKYLEKS